MEVSSRRLAIVQHRHPPAHGLLTLISFLSAFLLTGIKRKPDNGGSGLRIVRLKVAIKARSPSASPTAWAGTGPAMGLFHLLGDGPLRLVARLLAIRDRVTAGMCCQQLSRLSKSGCYGRRSLLPQNARLGSLTLCLRVS